MGNRTCWVLREWLQPAVMLPFALVFGTRAVVFHFPGYLLVLHIPVLWRWETVKWQFKKVQITLSHIPVRRSFGLSVIYWWINPIEISILVVSMQKVQEHTHMHSSQVCACVCERESGSVHIQTGRATEGRCSLTLSFSSSLSQSDFFQRPFQIHAYEPTTWKRPCDSLLVIHLKVCLSPINHTCVDRDSGQWKNEQEPFCWSTC